jgi:hypothetical protein
VKKLLIATLFVAVWFGTSLAADADGCNVIQDGIIFDSVGQVITTGYDEWGYNYQAHMFNGIYCEARRSAQWCLDNPDLADIDLLMKWNDAWLSNKDCYGDGLLDRHYGYASYIGSGAWLTNHQSGSYEIEVKGKLKTIHWTYFVKIVAVPIDATEVDGIWVGADGIDIGPSIWGSFAVVQEVENDPGAAIHGIQYLSPSGSGFGQYGPE